jgi:hypothetical protein
MVLNCISFRDQSPGLGLSSSQSGELAVFKLCCPLNLRGGTGFNQEVERADCQSSSSGLKFGLGKFLSIESSEAVAESWNAAIEKDNAAIEREKAAAYGFTLPEFADGAFTGVHWSCNTCS